MAYELPDALKKSIRRKDSKEICEYLDGLYNKKDGLKAMLEKVDAMMEFAKREAAKIFQEEGLQSRKDHLGRSWSVRTDTYFTGMPGAARLAFCKSPTIRLAKTKEDCETEARVLQEMVKTEVNAQTFTSWLRKRHEAGLKLPQSVNVNSVARVVRKKK